MQRKNRKKTGGKPKLLVRLQDSRFGDQKYRSIRFAGFSCVSNTLLGLGKLVLGIATLSFFTCVSGFYTLGTVGAKVCAMVGLIKEQGRKEQFRYYKLSGVILTIASLLYIAYSVRVCFVPTTAKYHEVAAICIAAFTCAEMIVNIRGVIKERKNHTPLIHAMKMINLASAAVCVVLTQTALLSFALEGENPLPWANGVMGIIMGSAATVLGIIMMVHISRMEKKEPAK